MGAVNDTRRLDADDPRFPTTAAARRHLQHDFQPPAVVAAAPFKHGPLPEPSVKQGTPELPADAITLGADANGHAFGVLLPRLLDGRLLVQGSSGAGKSWLLRRLLESSSGKVQQIVIDPEGEFRSFAESADIPFVDAGRLNGAGYAALGTRVREQRLSLVFDVAQLDRERQMIAIAGFLRAMIDSAVEHWHPALVVIDEAHLFAPFGGGGVEPSYVRKAAIGAVVDLMSRGRKRGLAGILATQRLARLSKSVASEATNLLVGHNALDLDIRRAAEIIGWDARRAFAVLPSLPPGGFVASGTAFNVTDGVMTIGKVRSRHGGAAPAISAPPLPSAAAAEDLLGIEQLADDGAELSPNLPVGFRMVRGFILEPAAPLAVRLFHELLPLYPNGAALAELARHFGVGRGSLEAAIQLLVRWDAVKLAGDAVGVVRGMTERQSGC